ncbi:unnamed protein product [Urochloa humidicola]
MAASHGPVMLLRFGRVPTVVASSAAAAEEAIKTREPRLGLLRAAPAAHGRAPVVRRPRRGLRALRRVLTPGASRVRAPHLLGPRRVPPSVVSASRRSPRSSPASAACAHAGTVNLSDILVCYSKVVISRAEFGDGDYGVDGDEGGREAEASAGRLPGAPPGGADAGDGAVAWVGRHVERAGGQDEALDGLLERVIADHRSWRLGGRRHVPADGEVAVDHRDFVDVLLDVNEMDEDAGLRLDTVNIKAIIMDMFVAGTNTSFTVLEWAMTELLNHPHQMQKLQADIRAAAGASTGHLVTEDHLGRVPYLKAVISETLRLHTPEPLLIPRETTEDTELLGYHIPARTP